jgi:hypothetical protein
MTTSDGHVLQLFDETLAGFDKAQLHAPTPRYLLIVLARYTT